MNKTNSVFKLLGLIFSLVGAAMLAGTLVFLSLEGDARIGAIPFGVNAFVFLGIGLSFLGVAIARSRRKDQLLSHGEAIIAEIVSLETVQNINMNGRHPARLICRYKENGTVYIYRSEEIYGYPELTAQSVTVYRDPYKPKRYYVDWENAVSMPVEL